MPSARCLSISFSSMICHWAWLSFSSCAMPAVYSSWLIFALASLSSY